jgi:outer membrane protein
MKYEMKSVILFFTLAVITTSAAAQDTLSLQEAVQLAVKNSPAMAAAAAGVQSAKARVDEAYSYAMPQLNGDASYTRIDPVISIDFPGQNGTTQSFSTMPHDNYNANLNVQQPIWAFGRFSANERVAESGVTAAEDNLKQASSQAAYQTTQVYYGILATDEAINVEQDQVRVLRENLAIAEVREKQGVATSLDALSLRARISALQSQIAEMQSTRAKQVAMLRRITGISPATTIRVSRPSTLSALTEQADTLQLLAERQRAEIIVAKDAENTARLQIAAASTANDPLLATNIQGGVKDGYLPNLTDPKLNWAGTVSFHMPILDGGRTRAQVDQADANYRMAQAHTQDVLLGIRSDIEQALADVQASRSRLALTETQIQQAQQAFDIAQVRYKNGAATNLEVLTAQSALEQANLQRAQLLYSYELSQYNLNRAVGTVMW